MIENSIENNFPKNENVDGISLKELNESFENNTDDGVSLEELYQGFEEWTINIKNNLIEGIIGDLPVSVMQILAEHGLLDNIADLDPNAFVQVDNSKWQQIDVKVIPPESISELPEVFVNNMSQEQFSNFSGEQIQSLTPTQVDGLSPEQLSSFGEYVSNLNDSATKILSPEQLQGLAENGTLQYINPNMVNSQSLEGWNNYSKLPPEYISYIPNEEFKTINVSSFTMEQINSLSLEQFQNIPITNLTPEQLSGLSKELTLTLSATDVQNLAAKGTLSNIDPETIAPESLKGLSDYSILPAQYIQYIPVDEFKNIDISNFSKEQIMGITKEQLDKLPLAETIKTYSKYFPEYDWENIKKDASVGAIIGGVLGLGIGFFTGGPIGAFYGLFEGSAIGGTGGGIAEGANQTAVFNGASETDGNIIETAVDMATGAVGVKVVEIGLEQVAKHSDGLLEAIKGIGKQEITQLPTLNSKLDGLKHEVTDIPFEKRIVDTPNGKVEGVWAKFDSLYDYRIPKETFDSDGILRWSDAKQFKNAIENLFINIEKNPKLAENFTSEQREQIGLGITPKEFTWHHKEDTGILQLVDSSIHDKTAHTGGAKLWTARHENT